MQKIYRKYPTIFKHDNSLLEVVQIIEYAFEPAAKAAACWVIGEYAEFIPKVIDLIVERIEK